MMKLAVTYENGEVFQHFGHTQQFKIYTVENDSIVSSEVIDTDGQGHGSLASFLSNRNVDVLLCGGVGGGAKNALAQAGIQLYPGVSGNADAQVEALIAGELNYDPNVMCSHHDEHHGNSCGSNHHHSCASHGCSNH